MTSSAYNMTWFQDLDEIRQAIEDGDDLLATEAEHVMKACGWDRWTSNTGPQIVRHLRTNGLEVFGDVPSGRRSPMRIFIPGSAIGRLVEAVRTPSLTGDEDLRSATRDETGVLEQIRALVGAS